MKINFYQDPGLKENHIDLYYSQIDEEITAIKQHLSAFEGMILGKDEETERERMMSPRRNSLHRGSGAENLCISK